MDICSVLYTITSKTNTTHNESLEKQNKVDKDVNVVVKILMMKILKHTGHCELFDPRLCNFRTCQNNTLTTSTTKPVLPLCQSLCESFFLLFL
jgi:hypothetical protein